MRQETFTLSQKKLQRGAVISQCVAGNLACAKGKSSGSSVWPVRMRLGASGGVYAGRAGLTSGVCRKRREDCVDWGGATLSREKNKGAARRPPLAPLGCKAAQKVIFATNCKMRIPSAAEANAP